MNKYEIKGETATIHAWYRAGLLVKMQVKKGKLNQSSLNLLADWMPLKESEMDEVEQRWPKLTYSLISGEPQKLYSQLVREWFNFYERLNGVRPKFTGTDGKAIRGIEKYLNEVCSDPMEALGTWQLILGQWHTLPEWYQQKTDLTFINAKMNEILTNLKHGKSTRQAKAATDADDLRRSL